MNTKILEYIIAIAETKSLTQAADRFYLSRPALSKHLKNIEERVGSPLFYRENKKLELTPAGVIYINNATAILQTEEELMKNLRNLKNDSTERIQVYTENSFVNFFYRRVMPRFKEKCPDAFLDLKLSRSDSIIQSLKDGQAQFGIFDTKRLSVPDLTMIPMVKTELCMIFPKNSEAYQCFLNQDYTNPALQNAMLAIHPTEQTASYFEKECLAAIKLTPKTSIEISFYTDAINCVKSGNVISFAPDIRIAREPLDSFDVGHMTPPYYITTVLAISQNHMMSKDEKELMNIILEEYEQISDYFLTEKLWTKVIADN